MTRSISSSGIAPAELVALRLRCLYVHFIRGWADALKRNYGRDEFRSALSPRELRERCLAILEDEHLGPAFTRRERRVIAAPLGSLPHYRIHEAMFRAEPVEVLAWSLGRGPAAPHFKPPARFAYRGLSPDTYLSGSVKPFLDSPRLRSRRELRARRDYEAAWTWRARLSELRRTIALREDAPESVERDFFGKQIRARARSCAARGWFKPLRGDFPLGGQPFELAFERDYFGSFYETVTAERLRAANWLLEPTREWHTTPTNTPLEFRLPPILRGNTRFLKTFMDPSDDDRWYS